MKTSTGLRLLGQELHKNSNPSSSYLPEWSWWLFNLSDPHFEHTLTPKQRHFPNTHPSSKLLILERIKVNLERERIVLTAMIRFGTFFMRPKCSSS